MTKYATVSVMPFSQLLSPSCIHITRTQRRLTSTPLAQQLLDDRIVEGERSTREAVHHMSMCSG